MPNGINNWTYKDVKKILLKKGFLLSRIKGSHHYYSGFCNKSIRAVTVPFHGKKAILPRTMNSIITQSGIPKKEWIE
ncbi:MAG: type II toxin-antitoxin system HicA family toxin [Flavobacteriaceae bacterium]